MQSSILKVVQLCRVSAEVRLKLTFAAGGIVNELN